MIVNLLIGWVFSFVHTILQVKPSISTTFIEEFLIRSKDSIRAAMKKVDDSLSFRRNDSRNMSQQADLTTKPNKPGRRLSCWKFLLGRRASRLAEKKDTPSRNAPSLTKLSML